MSPFILDAIAWGSKSIYFNVSVAFLSALILGFISRSYGTSMTTYGPVRQFGFVKKRAEYMTDHDCVKGCPYEYLLQIYGEHHFQPFVTFFAPELQREDPEKYLLILDIMDAVHFCLILVDDISDDSPQRKSQPTAHLLYGASETANRAYFILTQVINRALRDRPVLGIELMNALEQILHGQDMSLVWRRDGLKSFPVDHNERIAAYREMARLKTGTLFVLLGRLVNDGKKDLDDLLTRFGWFAQLQNDCKDIYSAEYAANKGAIAEDLRNGELTFPVVLALNSEGTSTTVSKAIESHREEDIQAGVRALRLSHIRAECLKSLQEAGQGLEQLVSLWGRRETMQSAGT